MEKRNEALETGSSKVGRLPRNVLVLSWVSLMQDAASEMLYPILPIFVTVVLGASPAVLGIIEGIAEGTASILKAVSGKISDKRRKRPMIAWGYGLSAVAKPIIGLAGGWPLVLLARFTDRVGKGIRTSPRDALIASDTTPENRGAAFGFHRAMDSAGAVVGPLLGLGLYQLMGHQLRPLFFVAFIPAALSVLLIGFVKERPLVKPSTESAKESGPLPKRYWRAVAFIALFGLINFSDTFILLRAKQLGLGFTQVILAYVLYNIAYASLSYPAGKLSDRIPRRYVFATGLVIFGVCYGGMGLATTATAVWLLLPLYGAYTALTDGVGKAWISSLLPKNIMGTGMGYFHAISGGSVLIASVWAGFAWGENGRTPLIFSGAIALILGAVLLLGGRSLENSQPDLAV